MKKSFILVAGLFVSQAAWSFDAGTYQGGGHWKQPTGEVGTWTETSVITKVEGGLEISSQLKVMKDKQLVHEESASVGIVYKEHGYFDVTQGGATIGSGYCFKTTCHYEYATADESGEETFHVTKKGLAKIGSAKMKKEGTETSVSWIGKLKKAK